MDASSSPVTTCPFCNYFAPSFKLYISHLRIVHSRDPSFQVICGIVGCTQTFRAFAAFNTHVYRHHRVALELETQNSTELDGECNINSTLESNANPPCASISTCPTATDTPATDTPICKLPIKKKDEAGAKFILHLREGRRVSQVAVNEVVQTSNEMCTKAINHLKQEIRETLLQANSDTVCDRITDILDRRYS